MVDRAGHSRALIPGIAIGATTALSSRPGPERAHPHAAMGRGHPESAAKPIGAYFVRPGCDPLTEAFTRREFSPPWRGSVPVDEADCDATLERVFATPRIDPAVVYVHVPFCQNHCLFCGFFQNVWRPEAADGFVDDVIAEIAQAAATPLVASASIEAIYIGGGTPSALSSEHLVRLLAGLRALLPLADDCEITLEGRSFGFGLPKAEAVLGAGATRISLGVETFNTDVRKRMGRKLAGADVRSFLAELVALGRASVVCDLIYGLPGQQPEDWRRDVGIADEIGLDGVTLYALNVFPGGPLSRAIESGKLPPAGSIQSQARDYAAGVELLTARGWRQAYQSHLIRSPREHNRYNAAIKRGVVCLPFGPGAGGQAHGYRWRNVIDLQQRRALQSKDRPPIERLSRVPPHYAAQALITAGLEVGRLDLAAVDGQRLGFQAAAAPLIDNWIAAGLGERDGNCFLPSRAGAFWITNLTGGLYAALNPATSG